MWPWRTCLAARAAIDRAQGSFQRSCAAPTTSTNRRSGAARHPVQDHIAVNRLSEPARKPDDTRPDRSVNAPVVAHEQPVLPDRHVQAPSVVRLPPARLRPETRPRAHRGTAAARVISLGLALLGASSLGCALIEREPEFGGALDKVTGASLRGPFDGQIVDAATGEPLRDAFVVGVWSFDVGDGFVSSKGSRSERIETDASGRYRIPPVKRPLTGPSVRLVSFHLLVYKAGYQAYRSDLLFEGGPRRNFVVRHNRIELQRWSEADSHAQHLLYLAAPRDIHAAAAWEEPLANLDLYRELGGALASDPVNGTGGGGGPIIGPGRLLDASSVLTPEAVGIRTSNPAPLEYVELEDLERTSYYHGFVLRAVDAPETNDLTVRVWLSPPDGLASVVATIQATLPGVAPSDEITPLTFRSHTPALSVIAFVDEGLDAAVVLTCGPDQCADADTTMLLARYIRQQLLKNFAVAPEEEDTQDPEGETESPEGAGPLADPNAAKPVDAGKLRPGGLPPPASPGGGSDAPAAPGGKKGGGR